MTRAGSRCLMLFAIITLPVAAQAQIWMRRSEVSIPVDAAECLARAFRSLRAEGFNANQNLYNGVWGSKGARWTLVVCNPAPAGQMWANIVSSAPEAEAAAHFPDHEHVAGGMYTASTAPVTTPKGCGWRDAQDPTAGSDPGRGVADWSVHYDYVNSGAGIATVQDLVGARLAVLNQCLSRESYAGLYAAASVKIAAAGRLGAGWVDGMDARTASDIGRGLSDQAVHRQYILSGAGASTAHSLVVQRMATLRAVLDRTVYARLYADLSVLIARCAVGGSCG